MTMVNRWVCTGNVVIFFLLVTVTSMLMFQSTKMVLCTLIGHIQNAPWLSHCNNDLSSDGKYLISFDDSLEGIADSVNNLRLLLPELKIHHTFHLLKVVAVSSVSMKDFHLIQSLSSVTHIEPDNYVEAMRVQKLNNVTTSWGIDRIDGKLDNKYHYAYTGRGVRVYIIDSGVQINHVEFNPKAKNNTTKRRARCGKNFRNDLGESCDDEWGHGTHVAAIIGMYKSKVFVLFNQRG